MADGLPEPLTAAEWKVMRVVWRRQGCAARDVYEEAGLAHGWAPTTAKSVLRRLVDKGYLTTTRVGNSFFYRPARSALESLRDAADGLLANALEGTSGPLISYLLKRSRLSAEELGRLRDLLEELGPEEEGRR